MFLIAHMGDPRVDVSGPKRMIPIAETFPRLRCIAAHLGNWGDWDPEKIRPLARLDNVYTDISSSFSYVEDKAPLYRILGEYDPTHVFFGSDYPIWCPQRELAKAGRWGWRRTFWRTFCLGISSNFTTTARCEQKSAPEHKLRGGFFAFTGFPCRCH